MKERVYSQLDHQQAREPAGIRKNRLTIDQIFILNQIIEKAEEYKFPLYVLLTDFSKTFDSVKYKFLWNAL